MTVVTSYPGIYIEEDATPSISVSNLPTAVPLFCMKADLTSDFVRFNSYLDVLNYYGGAPDFTDSSVAGLRAYFESGGGTCYATQFDDIVSVAQRLKDTVTLAVSNGNNIATLTGAMTDPDIGIFVIQDGPADEIAASGAADGYTADPGSAVYYPYLNVGWTSTAVPPSAVMAGLYCKNDRSRGVWKAPANMPLPAGYVPKFKVTDTLQGTYNKGRAINMIRAFNDGGPTVWGARTLDDSDNWRYISVRRLFNSAERDIRNAMSDVVFEPNTPPTWERVRTAITNYLHALWRQGGLAGGSEKEAFFVQIGEGTTMTEDDINQGKMIAAVGMAAARPAEFIILQFTQDMQAA